MAWINDYIQINVWNVIIYLRPNCNCGLAKPPLKFGMDGYYIFRNYRFDYLAMPYSQLIFNSKICPWDPFTNIV